MYLPFFHRSKCDRIGCQWCFIDGNNNRLKKSFCDYDNVCPFGKLKPIPPSATKKRSSNAVAIGVSIAVIIIVILIILVIVFLWKRGKLSVKGRDADNLDNERKPETPDNEKSVYPDVVVNVPLEEKPDEGWF